MRERRRCARPENAVVIRVARARGVLQVRGVSAPRSTIIHSARLVDGGTVSDNAWVQFIGTRVAATGVNAGWRAHSSGHQNELIVDAAGSWLTPGFIDIHGHGGGGASYDDGAAQILTARALHRAHGTTRAVISLVTAPMDVLLARLELVAKLCGEHPDILGSHLEGPFLAPSRKGAHDAAYLREPAAGALARLIAAGRGTLRQVTLAPELAGGIAAVAQLRAAGVIAAIGHTDTDFAGARRAIDAGASVLTHAFNAMRGLHHREPGPVAAVTGDLRVVLELIADGVHVHPEIVRMLFAAAPDRVALVTDAMAAAGASNGRYELGTQEVDVVDGVARLRAGGAIAGSTLTQDAALRWSVETAGVPLPDAVTALTATPAQAIGRGTDLGRLLPGYAADAVLLDPELRVHAVWCEGERAGFRTSSPKVCPNPA